MKRIFEHDNHNHNEPNRKVNLRKWISLEKVSLSFEDLYIVLNEIQEEINLRTTNIREMIPNDVWMSIFQSISNKNGQDISLIVPLKLVCKNWQKVFLDCTLTRILINKPSSIKLLPLFPHIQSLCIQIECEIPLDYFEKYLTNLVSLELDSPDIRISYASEKFSEDINEVNEKVFSKGCWNKINFIVDFIFGHMTNLKKLKLYDSSPHHFGKFFLDILKKNIPLINATCLKSFRSIEYIKVRQLSSNSIPHLSEIFASLTNFKKLDIKEMFWLIGLQDSQLRLILDDLSRFEHVKLPREGYINCYQIQKKNPKVRFQWYIFENKEGKIGKYEGSFSENNDREGRGVFCNDVSRYEGEWMNDVREGVGEMRYGGSEYKGEWKNGTIEGKGIMHYLDGSKYEGEWRNGKREGIGKIRCRGNEYEYEGEWKDGKMEGKGNIRYSDGSQYEGEWMNGKREGMGIMLYSDGQKYEGGWKSEKREGKGIMLFSDGHKYEGEWKNDMKEGTTSDGSQYEGEWKNNEQLGKSNQ